jgi:cytosine/creatinine deaminase
MKLAKPGLATLTPAERSMMEHAIAEAEAGFSEGGLPIGSVLARGDILLGKGHNRRVQQGDPIAHGEMDCLRNAGRQRTYRDLTLFTTLSPCMMCAGTIVQFKIPRVIIGENRTFGGNEAFLAEHGVEVVILDEPRCISLIGTIPGRLSRCLE